jgi:SpoIIAA-like
MGSAVTSAGPAAPYVMEPLGADGIATFRYQAGTVLTEAIARSAMADLGILTNGNRQPLLADIRKVKTLTREARVFFDNVTDKFSALALLAGSPATQLMVNFFLGMSHPKVPTRMFTDEEKARAWLRRHVV